ncbi:MAG: hypothetical protein M4579_004654 [Chaenotheca gracillima]|nr:MAG: hypothetical protein M4579_004654 [Chaenotheca gracillima]
MYRFGGGDHYSPNQSRRHPDDHRDRDTRREEFSFSSNQPLPQYPARDGFDDHHYRPRERDDGRGIPIKGRGRGRGNGARRGGRQNGFRGRGGYKNEPPSERPLLVSERLTTPERLAGMNNEEERAGRYMSANDVSDSSEESMDVESQSDDAANDQPRKKQLLEPTAEQKKEASEPPRWSNPDVYTALPASDLKKRKDVVKLIRKARIAPVKTDEPRNASASNEDFISFDFGGEPNGEGDNKTNDHSDASHSQSEGSLDSESRLVNGRDRPWGGQSRNGDSGASNRPPPRGPRAEVGLDVWPPPSNDAALGNRKRTHDDQIKGDSGPGRTKVSKKPGTGAVISEWKARDTASATPWCDVDHSASESVGFWLHKEICDFYDYVRPREFEDVMRQNLIQRLRTILPSRYPRSDVRCFGSFAAGLYLPNADMDLVMVSDRYLDTGFKMLGGQASFYFGFADFLKRNNIPRPGSVEIIAKAKVPLVKYIDRLTGLRVDMSFENDTGLIANRTFQEWKRDYPAMPIIVTIIKQFLAMRNLNEVVSGGLGGFSVTCLVTSMLQLMPQVQSHNMQPERHLGETLMEFFDLYGNEFNPRATGIKLNPPAYFEKRLQKNVPYRKHNPDRLAIVDPNKSDNDISGGTSNIKTILQTFANAFGILQDRMSDMHYADYSERKGQSILRTILAGDYSNFELQRERLRDLYDEKFASGTKHRPYPIRLDIELGEDPRAM